MTPYYIEKERKVIVIPAIYKNNVKYGGSSSSSNIDADKFAQKVELTLAEYEALGDSVKTDNIMYFITDAESTNSGSVNTDAETLGGYSADDFAKTTDLENYLPTTGGTQYKNASIYNHISTDLRDVLYGIDHNGALIVKDDTNGKTLIVSLIDGTTTYYGNLDGTASGNLPLTGGTLTDDLRLSNGTEAVQLIINRNLSDGTEVYSHAWTTNVGQAAFGIYDVTNAKDLAKILVDEENLLYQQNGVTTNTVIHSGNIADYACTTSVVDVDRTLITFGDSTNYSATSDAHNWYCVKHGICYYSLHITVVNKTSTWSIPNVMMPKPISNAYNTFPPFEISASDSTALCYYIHSDGNLQFREGAVGNKYLISGSYPVAES